jgi:DNA polymerase-3 subunit alpha
MFAGLDITLRHGQLLQEEAASAQVNLFGDVEDENTLPPLPDVEPWNLLDMLERERDAIGFYLSAHPLDEYGELLKRLRVTRISNLADRARSDGHAKIAGVVLGRQERSNARGNRYAFVQLSDSTGMVEVTLFSEVLATARETLDSGSPVMMGVEVRLDGDSLKITAHSVDNLEKVAATRTEAIKVFVNDTTPLPSIQKMLGGEAGGKGQISIVLGLDPLREVEIDLPGRYTVTPQVAAMLKAVRGVVDVEQVARV